MFISVIKPTKNTRATFGSKVAYHYFPSIVPAFDNAEVKDVGMKSWAYRDFRERRRGWVEGIYDFEDEPFLLNFALYFAFGHEQIASAPDASLDRTCEEIGKRCRDEVSASMWNDETSLHWRLDAKVAEFCLCGHANRATTREPNRAVGSMVIIRRRKREPIWYPKTDSLLWGYSPLPIWTGSPFNQIIAHVLQHSPNAFEVTDLHQGKCLRDPA
jgi:hypothetical protein